MDRILSVSPEVISHNMETVKRLTREVRIQAKYERSLGVLEYLKENGGYNGKQINIIERLSKHLNENGVLYHKLEAVYLYSLVVGISSEYMGRNDYPVEQIIKLLVTKYKTLK